MASEYACLADEEKRLLKDALLILASGAFLAVHFSCWVWVSKAAYASATFGSLAFMSCLLYCHNQW